MPSISIDGAGGCHCGALRYRAAGSVGESVYCHCTICQRTTGAPALAAFTLAAAAFAYTRGKPAAYRSSAAGVREFCSRCGCQILWRADDGSMVAVNTPTLDAPEAMPPTLHIHAAKRLAWFDAGADLPAFAEEPERPARPGQSP